MHQSSLGPSKHNTYNQQTYKMSCLHSDEAYNNQQHINVETDIQTDKQREREREKEKEGERDTINGGEVTR